MNNPERPNERTLRPCNDIGLIIESRCRLPEIKFYVEGRNVNFYATATDFEGKEFEVLQYLSPEHAMRFAKAMEACAIEALKNID